jgi:transcriptional regulator with XRE-family HTH domain
MVSLVAMKLSSYLDAAKETHEAFAKRIGVSQAAVSRYAAGARLPRPEVLHRIVEATGGKVTANDFLSDEAVEMIAGAAA